MILWTTALINNRRSDDVIYALWAGVSTLWANYCSIRLPTVRYADRAVRTDLMTATAIKYTETDSWMVTRTKMLYSWYWCSSIAADDAVTAADGDDEDDDVTTVVAAGWMIRATFVGIQRPVTLLERCPRPSQGRPAFWMTENRSFRMRRSVWVGIKSRWPAPIGGRTAMI